MTRPSPRRLPRTVIALGWVSLLTDLSSEMIYPLLPVFLTGVLGPWGWPPCRRAWGSA